jgi:hypothetical protein
VGKSTREFEFGVALRHHGSVRFSQHNSITRKTTIHLIKSKNPKPINRVCIQ